METLSLVLILLAIVGISNIINHFLPFIPVPLVQVGLGILAAFFPSGIHIVVEPELFFVLFVAPLLFNDGKRIPRDELWNLKAPILLLALGLVFATVFVAGYIIHLIIPSLPLPAAFALAAILSPTDAVAVSALSGRIHLPKTILHLLEGEALMNDASGLVAFKFAIAAAVTGAFSLAQATASFFIISVGGILLGAILAFLIIRLRVFLRQLGIEDVTMHMLIQILTPFAIYLVSEHFGVSGILAVVAGGIVHAIERDRAESPMVQLQVVSASTWSVILFILNGLVFVLLGLQIPDVLRVIFTSPSFNNARVVGYIFVISATLMILRFLWILVFSHGRHILNKKKGRNKIGLKPMVLTSLSGVRGAVTLAAAFSIPLFLENGSPFPQRDLMIFLAAGVILVTLLTASIVLPLISKKKGNTEDERNKLEQAAKIKIVKTVIRTMEKEMKDDHKAAYLSVITYYNRLLRQIRGENKDYRPRLGTRKAETDIRLLALRAEQKEIQHLLENGQIDSDTAYRFQKGFKHMEMLFEGKFKFKLSVPLLIIKRFVSAFTPKGRKLRKHMSDLVNLEAFRNVRLHTLKAAIRALEAETSAENKKTALALIAHYNESIDRLNTGFETINNDADGDLHKKELFYRAIQIERNEVQVLFESGGITREVANKLRQFINHTEAAMLEDENIVDL